MRNLEKTTTTTTTSTTTVMSNDYSGFGITIGMLTSGIGLKFELYFIAALGLVMIIASLHSKRSK